MTDDDSDVKNEQQRTERDAEYTSKDATRYTVLDRLVEGPADAATVAGGRSIDTTTASNALRELEWHSLVERLIDGQEPVYGITQSGEQAMFQLQKS